MKVGRRTLGVLGTALTVTALAVPVVVAQAPPAANPRGIFLGGTTLAVSAEVELERDGKRGMVPSNHEFRSGDRFWLHVTVNRNAYVYVLNRTLTGPGAASRGIKLLAEADKDRKATSSDTYTLVFPAPNTAAPIVRKGTPTIIPGRGLYFAMDDVPGAEKLLVVASETPLANVTSSFDPATGRLAAANKSDSVGSVLDRLNGELVRAAENTASSRDIAIVDAPAPAPTGPDPKPQPPSKKEGNTNSPPPKPGRQGGGPSTDYATPRKPGPMLLELTLTHLPG